jgi:Arc/MetJ family transcription regulator
LGADTAPLPKTFKVYHGCMARTNIDLDDDACRSVMARYHLSTKRDAVNFALRMVAAEPLDLDEARALRGAGWEGDLEQMRSGRDG